ncbi:mechanosensitive ion channel family protein [Reinekea thalattae]|nr:mechanosensitive ion channel domain-containing protein [Reinekea thalattae]
MLSWLINFEPSSGPFNLVHPVAWLAISFAASLLLCSLLIALLKPAFKSGSLIENRRIQLTLLLMLWVLSLAMLSEQYLATLVRQRIVIAVQSIAFLLAVMNLALYLFPSKKIGRLLLYSITPIIALNFFDLLDPITHSLDNYRLSIGGINISLFDVVKLAYIGGILFWFGRESNRVVKQNIRKQQHLDSSTREIIAKLFEVGFITLLIVLLLNVVGVNLTTLAVFGGALGVGLGFGLQSIASNFVSGLIILMDRSLSIGDYIELESGQSGIIRELNLRSITLETFDGKDIVVPNDVFFSQTFTNWTHKNTQQRYSLSFSVAYKTDLDALFPLVIDSLKANPQVLSGPQYSIAEQPDIEIKGFGDNGIDLLVEFWMNAVDDGENRVSADILYSIWKLMNEHGFEFPFPQREVRILP